VRIFGYVRISTPLQTFVLLDRLTKMSVLRGEICENFWLCENQYTFTNFRSVRQANKNECFEGRNL